MANQLAVNSNSIKKSAGFSILEVIFVLAFLGLLLAAITTYVRKAADERNRQLVADAVAQDISGLLKFINADTINAKLTVVNESSGTKLEKDDVIVVNPLYQRSDELAYQDQLEPEDGFNITANPLVRIHANRGYGRLSDKGVWTAASWAKPLLPYTTRVWTEGEHFAIKNGETYKGGTIYSQPIKWSQRLWSDPNNGSMRNYFTDSGCPLPAGQSAWYGKTQIYFKQQYLTCSESPLLKNSEIAISRIDMISSKGSRVPAKNLPQPTAIDRVDVYVSFMPKDNKLARIGQYYDPLIDAFKKLDIIPTGEVYLVKQKGNSGDEKLKWDFVDKTDLNKTITSIPLTNPKPALDKLTKYNDLLDPVDGVKKFPAPSAGAAQAIYGLRFSFNGKGSYLRTDGGNTASKICWNAKDNSAAPCIYGETADLLAVKKRNSNDFATVQAASVVLQGTAYDKDKNPITEYYTAPHIQYASFSNKGSLAPAYQCNNTPDGQPPKLCRQSTTTDSGAPEVPYTDLSVSKVTNPANGAINIPLQVCPQAVDAKGNPAVVKDGKAQPLYPRIGVAISSAISGLLKDGDNGAIDTNTAPVQSIFYDQSHMLNNLDKFTTLKPNGISINRLGGVLFNVLREDKEWRIGSMVSTEDSNGRGQTWQYFNPPWLSVVVTTWCSTVPQN